jgi:acyl-CoA reductase-like NAD-dependent aldehyde dehydrogenase
MNERLKQLLGQAYDEAVPETWTTLSSEQLGRVYEKFAELIVRECADKVDWILAEGGKTQGDLIRKHFGVEE